MRTSLRRPAPTIDWGDVRPSPVQRERVEDLVSEIELPEASIELSRRSSGFAAVLRVPSAEGDTDAWIGGSDLDSVVRRTVGLARLVAPR